jgi:hypothetical protein
MTTLDYANVFETEFRFGRRLRRIVARVLWAALYLFRPKLALEIWRCR